VSDRPNDRLVDALTTTSALSDLFSDASMLGAMLEFEAALATVEGRLGVIPAAAAETIAAVARDIDLPGVDMAPFLKETRRSATPAIPLVSLLVDRVRAVDPAAAAFVHWGATSQDVADTALVLLLTRVRPRLEPDYAALVTGLRRLSDTHAATIMLGRTLLQPATPITFGVKAAVWYANVWEGWWRLQSALGEVAQVQFGGASGTRASLGSDAPRVTVALASELGLQAAPPWHTRRGRLAQVGSACAILAGGLGKIARDVALLMQAEVSELAAPGGGSSAMPHKRNPSGSAVALAAVDRVPGLVAGLLAGLVHEHERALGGWQLEWPALSATLQATGAALAAMAETVTNLQVFPERMRANLDATHGVIFAERASLLLRAAAGRDAAEAIVSRALARGRDGRTTFSAALRADADAVRALGPSLDRLDSFDEDIAAAETIRRELLSEA
jgi:3-carboxy-cis,cis-muconate cycloisomerase